MLCEKHSDSPYARLVPLLPKDVKSWHIPDMIALEKGKRQGSMTTGVDTQ